MNVDERYLEWYSTQIRGRPSEIALNGYEAPASRVISIDDPDGTYLSVSYTDEYPPDTKPSEILEGADKRSTFVIPMRGPNQVGSVGWRFAGLILLDDLRSWYRRKFELDVSETGEDK